MRFIGTRALALALGLVVVGLAPSSSLAAWTPDGPQDFKGDPLLRANHVTVMFGLSIIRDDTAGFDKGISYARRIAESGFVPDVNDQAFIEMRVASISVANAGIFAFSTHLRWDFR